MSNAQDEVRINLDTNTNTIPHVHTRYSNRVPQTAPGASSAIGHTIENSIPLSIFPIAIDKICICFCGLPGRGKTHISRRLARYLEFFIALPVALFNVGEYRIRMYGAMNDAEFFDNNNEEANHIRKVCNDAAASDMVNFLNSNSNAVAIWDSTNATHNKRIELVEKVRPTGAKIMFIEVTSDNEVSLSANYHETALTNPDYVGVSLEDATLDYRNRISKYVAYFEPLHSGNSASIESKWSYFKCDHSKRHFVVHNVSGNLQLKIVNFIMNLRTTSHPFYLSRHGQSEYNSVGRIGGDSSLSEHGLQYAHSLAKFVEETIIKDANGNDVPARLWTSTLRRTKETAQFIKECKIIVKDRDDEEQEIEWVQMRPRAWHHLDELFAGSCDGMTYEEIEEEYPEEFSRRSVDKLAYRYPRGESYLDVIARLEPIIIEMERHREPLLIVGHQGILRIIYAFYMGLSRSDAPYVSIPLNTVIKLVPSAFGCSEDRIVLYNPPKVFNADGQDEPHRNKNNIDPQSH